MQFYFIRHAQSQNNALWDATGSDAARLEDPELTLIGQQQAQYVAEFMRIGQTKAVTNTHKHKHDPQNVYGLELTHLYCSLMTRAAQTATAIGNAINLHPVAWPDVHEHGGIYLANAAGERMGLPGKPRSYFRQNFPHLQLPNDLDEQGWWQNRPFEDWDVCNQRAERFVNELQARHGNSNDRVGVVSHGAFYGSVMRYILKMPPYDDHPSWFTLNNVAITRVDFNPKEILVVYMNRCHFLPSEMVS